MKIILGQTLKFSFEIESLCWQMMPFTSHPSKTGRRASSGFNKRQRGKKRTTPIISWLSPSSTLLMSCKRLVVDFARQTDFVRPFTAKVTSVPTPISVRQFAPTGMWFTLFTYTVFSHQRAKFKNGTLGSSQRCVYTFIYTWLLFYMMFNMLVWYKQCTVFSFVHKISLTCHLLG